MAWKYVMLQSTIGETKVLHPIIFPDLLVHRDVAMAIRKECPGWHHGGVRAISAGMIARVTVPEPTGESETLGLKARASDQDVIITLPYSHGIRHASSELVQRTLRAIQEGKRR